MNTQVLAMWITLIGSIITVILLIAWSLTGRQNATLRVLGGIGAIISSLAFLYSRFGG